MRTKYKPWAKPLIDEHPEYLFNMEEVSSLKHVHLEIGSGKGQFIIECARDNPDVNFIAVEKNTTCAGFIMKKLLEDKPHNIKLLNADAFFLLQAMEEECVDVLYLNFSDPWPKKRHEKRRLTHNSFIDLYVKVLAKGGEIRFKTDNDELYEFSKEVLANRQDLEIILNEEDYLGEDPHDYKTEYEIKKRNAGLKIHRMILRKK